MLIKAETENFKSFEQETELSLVSSAKIRSHQDHKLELCGANILKYAVIYGANASGKSNLVSFFSVMKKIVLFGLSHEFSQDFSKTKADNQNLPTEFSVQISLDQGVYAFGFRADLNQMRIVEEWLFELKADGSARPLYSIDAKENYKIEVDGRLKRGLEHNPEEKKRFEVYATDYAQSPVHKDLFLTLMVKNKLISAKSPLNVFREVYSWFKDDLKIISPNTHSMRLDVDRYEVDTEEICRLISSFDTGIESISMKELPITELPSEIRFIIENQVKRADSLLNNSDGNYAKSDQKEAADETVLTIRSNDEYYSVSFRKNTPVQIRQLVFNHYGSSLDFFLQEESEGTRRLLDLIDILLSNKNNQTYIIDELDRSFHPNMTRYFIENFLKVNEGRNNQLIFTTHASSLLNQEIFRRDEYWFVERQKDGTSILYPLDTFKVRHDKLLHKDYLEGRYGAVPAFSGFVYADDDGDIPS